MKKTSCTLAFDIGHSSIGWAVMKADKPAPEAPEMLGCGSVTFPADDCLASSRRDFRRSRRHARSTRQRIHRIKELLLHLGVLSDQELNEVGHPAPFLLAAQAISHGRILSWIELWHVMRWYAHNRGYDGNRRWSKHAEEDSEDSKKEAIAREQLAKYGTETMAETLCAILKLDPTKELDKLTHETPAYKTLGAAYPRSIVQNEVLTLLGHLKGELPHLDQKFIDTLIAPDDKRDEPTWNTIPVSSIKLPKRYCGGLLFGQLIPRFDNRIIARCPISGEKAPNKSCIDFLRYRWAMLVANIKSDGKPLSAEQRQHLNSVMKQHGAITSTELHKEVTQLTGSDKNNIKASFEIHPDSQDALVLDPAIAYGNNTRSAIAPYWKHLPTTVRKKAQGRWKKGHTISIQWMFEQILQANENDSMLSNAVDTAWDKDQASKKPKYKSRDQLLNRNFAPKPISGRAPYSRATMRLATDFVFTTNQHPTAEGGPLYRSQEIRDREQNTPIDKLTNNHLVRHRLKILLKLTDDILAEYTEDQGEHISHILVEVARDLQEFSGLSAKEMSRELNDRLRHFKDAVDHLQKYAPNLPLTGSLIRKCRIAMDLDWYCPFTGKRFDPQELPQLDREHIIPYSLRPTNALYALVLTWPEVNRMKGKLTAREFIKKYEAQTVEGKSTLTLFTLKQYDTFVSKLSIKGHTDDMRRKRRRRALLAIDQYEQKDLGFTEGSLTQTSHLNRLSARQLGKRLPNAVITSIPGQVTAEVRKAWNLMGTLAKACPEILMPSIQQLEAKATQKAQAAIKKALKKGAELSDDDQQGIIETFIDEIPQPAKDLAGSTKPKADIRGLTHLHHALDAATLALTHHYLPKGSNGSIWQALVKRNKSPQDWAILLALGVFKKDAQGRNGLQDIPKEVKNQLADKLAECRVVQHIPADMTGVKAELNTWRVKHIEGKGSSALVSLQQRTSEIGKDGKRVITQKKKKERAGKLLGLHPEGGIGKLKKLKGALIISDNYGLALDPEPTIIPFHKVWHRIQALKKRNGNKPVRILRNGMLISISTNPPRSSQDYSGVWKIVSIKNNKTGPALDVIRPSYVKAQNGVNWSGMNKSIQPFLDAGLKIIPPTLTGISKG